MHPKYLTHARVSGFTLIELAVVLMAIGLIAAGIVVGQSMIVSSQIQSVITDSQKYIEAAKQFKEKYGYLPGDFPNAQSYWGSNSSCPGTNTTSASQATCNGNGDGIIGSEGQGTYASGNTGYYEMWMAWQHLSDAGFIQGTFTGTNGSKGTTSSPDNETRYNIPASRLNGGGFAWDYWNAATSSAGSGCTSGYSIAGCFFNLKTYQQYLVIGTPVTGYTLLGSMFTPADALSIDSKIDDGLPVSGQLTSNNTELHNTTPCTTSDNATTAVYNVSGLNWTGKAGNTTACILLLEVDW